MHLTEAQEDFLVDTYNISDLIEILEDNELITIYHVIDAFGDVLSEHFDLFRDREDPVLEDPYA